MYWSGYVILYISVFKPLKQSCGWCLYALAIHTLYHSPRVIGSDCGWAGIVWLAQSVYAWRCNFCGFNAGCGFLVDLLCCRVVGRRFAFIIMGIAVFWGLFRFQFLDVVPVARDTVIDGM